MAPLSRRVFDQHHGRPHSQVGQFLSWPGGLSPSVATLGPQVQLDNKSIYQQINIINIHIYTTKSLLQLHLLQKALLLQLLQSLLLDRRNREILQTSLVPVLNHQFTPLFYLWHSSLPQFAMRSADLCQEIKCRVKRLNLVELLQLLMRYFLKNRINYLFKLISIFGSILKYQLVSAEIPLENDPWAVQQLYLTIQFYFLQGFGTSRNARNLTSLVSFQTVDHTTFAYIRITNQSDCDCPGSPLNLRQLLQQLNQVISSNCLIGVNQSISHVSAVCNRFFEEIES